MILLNFARRIMISKNQIKLIRQLDKKKNRQRERLFVAEGPKVVGDFMTHHQPAMLFATDDYTPPCPADVQRISPDELSKISFLQHPQQVLALFPLPDEPTDDALHIARQHASGALTLALDGVQDPGNLGTIIRIADWFGIDTILCSDDTADAWNPKVVQATMGSLARVRLFYTDLPAWLRGLPSDTPVYGTLLDGDNIYSQPLSARGIIIMGNEGNGLSPQVRPLVTHRLLIPSYGSGDTAESLNVAIATAVVCAEFRRRES
jgi:TrmH family RNA methyltransferase